MSEELAVDLRELNEMRETQGLEAAINLAERMAVAESYIEPIRDDPRLFTDGPPDPFTTYLERERAEASITREHQDDDTQMNSRQKRALNSSATSGLRTRNYRLLEPVDPAVNYSFEVVAADPWTLELSADKWWIDEDGRIGNQAQTLKTYSLESYEWERETEREIASMDREDLHRTYQESGLEAAMHQAEALAVANDELDPNRADGRLFSKDRRIASPLCARQNWRGWMQRRLGKAAAISPMAPRNYPLFPRLNRLAGMRLWLRKPMTNLNRSATIGRYTTVQLRLRKVNALVPRFS